MSETATKPGREFYMRSNPRYLQCEILVDQDQRIKNASHRTILAKTPDDRIFMACLGMGTWCEADFSDFAVWFRLVRDNAEKIRHYQRIDLVEHFKWQFVRVDGGWTLLNEVGVPCPSIGVHDNYMAVFHLAVQQAMDNEHNALLYKGSTHFPPMLLQAMVNQIRWRNQHNPAIPDPAWMNQL